MDNLSRAIIMAGEVLLFVTALSISVVLYTTLINTQDTVLLAASRYSQKAEQANYKTEDEGKRSVKGEEVIWTVLSLLDDKNYVAEKVIVRGTAYSRISKEEKNKIKEANLFQRINVNDEYMPSYSADGKTITFY